MTGWFQRSVSFAAMVRDSVSAAPAESGTTMRSGRFGYDCASALLEKSATAQKIHLITWRPAGSRSSR